jgi:hypothetical protein
MLTETGSVVYGLICQSSSMAPRLDADFDSAIVNFITALGAVRQQRAPFETRMASKSCACSNTRYHLKQICIRLVSYPVTGFLNRHLDC